ncbi:MAG TPA: ribonuclease P protein component [Anaerolineales bacterium]
MKRRFRLTKSTDFKRVRRMGKSYAHPLLVLIAHPNDLDRSRFGVAAGRSLGKAVQRNRAKRRIREALRPLIPGVEPGWDIIILARGKLLAASFHHCQEALKDLLRRARLLKDPYDDGIPS